MPQTFCDSRFATVYSSLAQFSLLPSAVRHTGEPLSFPSQKKGSMSSSGAPRGRGRGAAGNNGNNSARRGKPQGSPSNGRGAGKNGAGGRPVQNGRGNSKSQGTNKKRGLYSPEVRLSLRAFVILSSAPPLEKVPPILFISI